MAGPQLDLDAAYRAYSRYVAYIGVRIMGTDDEIDDLVQDVFADACRGLRHLRDLDAAKAWLGTVTVRAATRRLRLRKLKRMLGLGAPFPELVWPGASPEQSAAISQVYRQLESFPPKRRAAWVLRVVEQEPMERVAQMCGCSLATAKRWIGQVQTALSQAGV